MSARNYVCPKLENIDKEELNAKTKAIVNIAEWIIVVISNIF